MMALRLDDWLYGTVLLELRSKESGASSAVVSQLQRQGVDLADVRGRGPYVLCRVKLRDFPAVYQASRRHGAKLRIREKSGLPYAWKRARKRKVMLIGPVLFVVIVSLLSSVIWHIRVSGLSEEDAATVRQAASMSGLYIGAWRWSVADVERLQSDIIKRVPSLTWAGVRIDGTTANIEAVEKIPGVKATSVTPHNIVASKPAVIEKVFATRGEVVVTPGQVVSPGQVLISGDLGGGAKQVPATGEVLAEVWYTSHVTVPLTVKRSALTGENAQSHYLLIGPLAIRVWGFKQPTFAHTLERDSTTSWSFGHFQSPLQWETVTLYQAQPEAIQKSVASAKQEALGLARQDVLGRMNKQGPVLGQVVLQSRVSHGNLYETVLTRVQEDIGIAHAIPEPKPPEQGSLPPSRAN